MKQFKYMIAALCLLFMPAAMYAAGTTTEKFNGIGSSALFLEVGQAAFARAQTEAAAFTPAAGTACAWTNKTGGTGATSIFANDQAAAIKNSGNFWVVWTTDSTGTCAAPTNGTGTGQINIRSYFQTDSVVGDRCVFRNTPTATAAQTCILVVPANTAGNATSNNGANLLTGVTDLAGPLPTTIINALNLAANSAFGVAGTDIRPEDALFATIRLFTAKGTAAGTGSTLVSGSVVAPNLEQYQGLGYGSGTCVSTAITAATIPTTGGVTYGGSVTSAYFALPGGTDPCDSKAAVTSFTVTPVGAAPIVVTANILNTSGLGNTNIKNVTRGVLGGYLSGDLCDAEDALAAQTYSATTHKIKVFLREPTSGTWNTTDFGLPAGLNQSQEQYVNVASNAPSTVQPLYIKSCSATPAAGTTGATQPAGPYRARVTSTGNMLLAITNITDGLGYAFWSTANYAPFTNSGSTPVTAKYLSVDGVDPIQTSYSNGCIPVTGATGTCALSNVTFPNVINGTYPIWSVLRLVTTSTTSAAQVTETPLLATAAQNQVSATQPDFAKISALKVVHSHFVPYGVPTSLSGALSANNHGASTVCTTAESGGDVGGYLYSLQNDGDYCTNFGVTSGIVGHRQ